MGNRHPSARRIWPLTCAPCRHRTLKRSKSLPNRRPVSMPKVTRESLTSGSKRTLISAPTAAQPWAWQWVSITRNITVHCRSITARRTLICSLHTAFAMPVTGRSLTSTGSRQVSFSIRKPKPAPNRPATTPAPVPTGS